MHLVLSTLYKLGIYRNGVFDTHVSRSSEHALDFCEKFIDNFGASFDYYFRWCTDVDRIGDMIYGCGVHNLVDVIHAVSNHGVKTTEDCKVLKDFNPELLNDFIVGFGRVPSYKEMMEL